MHSGFVWFTWLKCGNHFAPLLQCNHCLVFGDVSLFCLLARPLLVCWQKGVQFLCVDVLGTTDGLLSQLLVALHPLVLYIAM